MTRRPLFFAGFLSLLLFLCGCAAHHRSAPNLSTYFVGPECHATAELLGCDGSSPPRCHRIVLHYARNCETIANHPEYRKVAER